MTKCCEISQVGCLVAGESVEQNSRIITLSNRIKRKSVMVCLIALKQIFCYFIELLM